MDTVQRMHNLTNSHRKTRLGLMLWGMAVTGMLWVGLPAWAQAADRDAGNTAVAASSDDDQQQDRLWSDGAPRSPENKEHVRPWRRDGRRDVGAPDTPQDGPPPPRAQGPGAEQMRRGGRGMGDDDQLHQWMSMSDDQREEVIRVVKEYFPEQVVDFLERNRDNRPLMGRVLLRMWPIIQQVMEAGRDDPEVARAIVQDHFIDIKIGRLVRNYSRTDDAELKEEIQQQVRTLLTEQFEYRQKIRQWRLERLEQELQRLRAELEERADKKEALIDREIERRLEERELPW